MSRPILFASVCALCLSASAVRAADPASPLLTSAPSAGAPVVAAPVLAAPKPVAPTIAPQAVTAPSKTVEGPGAVELAALYYYARNKEEARLKAEFARLQYKYPDFEMPADLYQPAAKPVDESKLWTLYGKDDFAGVDAELARLATARPGWTPSADFQAKLARKKMRFALKTAVKARNWQGAAATGATIDPATEKEIDLVWDMIDAYSALGDRERMARFYRALLFRDPTHQIPKTAVVATIKKSTRDFTPDDVRGVMATFAADPVVSAGLTSVATDLTRKAVAEFNADKTKATPLAKTDIDALANAATEGKAPADFSLLGWYYLKIKEPANAGAWFRRAIEAEPTVDHAKGLYLALMGQARDQEAYELAVAYKQALISDPVFLMNALAARISGPHADSVKPEAVAAYAEAILAAKSGPHAEILAWYAYNSGQFPAARAWFDKAFAWEPNEARLKGLALSEGQLGDRAALVSLYKAYGKTYPTIWDDVHLAKKGARRTAARLVVDRMQVGAVETKAETREPDFIEASPRREEPVRTEPRRGSRVVAATGFGALLGQKRYGDCVAAIAAREATHGLSAGDQLAKGWCMMGLKRNSEAQAAFSAALSGGGKTQGDAAYGLALTLLRNQMTSEAQSVISLYPLGAARDKEIRLEIYWQMARSAFDRKDYRQSLDALNERMRLAPEPVDMTQLRAWAHYNLGNKAEAKAIFETLADYVDDGGVRRGLAAATAGPTGGR
jgi:tetratricopeptide (TPR) repeat protein